jgi:hypothetical protein
MHPAHCDDQGVPVLVTREMPRRVEPKTLRSHAKSARGKVKVPTTGGIDDPCKTKEQDGVSLHQIYTTSQATNFAFYTNQNISHGPWLATEMIQGEHR